MPAIASVAFLQRLNPAHVPGLVLSRLPLVTYFPPPHPNKQVEEESLVKSYYAKKIQETCGRDSADEDLRRSDKVQVRTHSPCFSRKHTEMVSGSIRLSSFALPNWRPPKCYPLNKEDDSGLACHSHRRLPIERVVLHAGDGCCVLPAFLPVEQRTGTRPHNSHVSEAERTSWFAICWAGGEGKITAAKRLAASSFPRNALRSTRNLLRNPRVYHGPEGERVVKRKLISLVG